MSINYLFKYYKCVKDNSVIGDKVNTINVLEGIHNYFCLSRYLRFGITYYSLIFQ